MLCQTTFSQPLVIPNNYIPILGFREFKYEFTRKYHLVLLFIFVIASKLRAAWKSTSVDHQAKQASRNHRNLKSIKPTGLIASLPRPFWVHVVPPVGCHLYLCLPQVYIPQKIMDPYKFNEGVHSTSTTTFCIQPPITSHH